MAGLMRQLGLGTQQNFEEAFKHYHKIKNHWIKAPLLLIAKVHQIISKFIEVPVQWTGKLLAKLNTQANFLAKIDTFENKYLMSHSFFFSRYISSSIRYFDLDDHREDDAKMFIIGGPRKGSGNFSISKIRMFSKITNMLKVSLIILIVLKVLLVLFNRKSLN